MAHPHAPKSPGVLDLDGDHHDGLVGTTAPLSAVFHASDEGFVDFHVASERLTLGTYHRHSVAVQHRPGHPVAGPQGALQSDRRHPVLGRRQVPSRLEPGGERRAGLVQDRAGRDGGLVPTRGTHQAPTVCRHGAVAASHTGQTMPSGQRNASRYARQAASSENMATYSR